jgi:hypothetical protein
MGDGRIDIAANLVVAVGLSRVHLQTIDIRRLTLLLKVALGSASISAQRGANVRFVEPAHRGWTSLVR